MSSYTWSRPHYLAVAILLFILWSSSPFLACWISRESTYAKELLNDVQKLEFRRIARKTWRYFEDFVNKKGNYLAPDNYQEDPPNGVAYRTSPTNIGLGMLAALTARDMGYIGTQELCDILCTTMDTIDKMEKWNGHLYNWYNTQTLEMLKPRYISTVDSGNFVCYLIALKEGLKEYLEKPLIDPVFVDGIYDTARLVNWQEGDLRHIQIPLENALELLRIKTIPRVLFCGQRLYQNFLWGWTVPKERDVWKSKLDNMLNMFRMEIETYLPWVNTFVKLSEQPGVLEGKAKFQN